MYVLIYYIPRYPILFILARSLGYGLMCLGGFELAYSSSILLWMTWEKVSEN